MSRDSRGRGPHVVQVGLHLDRFRRSPHELLARWRDFARPAAAAVRAGVRLSVVQAAWADAAIDVEGVPCRFVREPWPVVRLPGRRWLRRRPRILIEQLVALSPDVVHYEGLILPRQLSALAKALPGVPILAQDHGSRVPTGWRRRTYRRGFARLAGVAFTARAQAEPFKAAGVLRPDLPVFEVTEGSSPFVPGDQAAARSAAGIGGDPCLLWVGNLDRNKDPLTALDAVACAARALPGLRLWMCYRFSPLLEAVRERIARDTALRERVRLVGEIPYPQIEHYFRAADFLVQASHVEGSGYGLIEALACGTTPLVTDIPSFRKITGDGEFGALLPLENPAALAGAIEEWSARDRAALRRRARAHFDRSLSFDAIGRQLRAAYQQVLDAR